MNDKKRNETVNPDEPDVENRDGGMVKRPGTSTPEHREPMTPNKEMPDDPGVGGQSGPGNPDSPNRWSDRV